MVAGHLTKRNGYYYVVLSYYDPDGKRHFKTFSTGLKVVSGNLRKAEEMLQKYRAEFFTPTCVNSMHSDMLFTAYLSKWLKIVRIRISENKDFHTNNFQICLFYCLLIFH